MKNKVKIIAEAGLNHNGNFKNVIKLIDIANDAKADYVKFQLFNTDQFINQKFNHKKIKIIKNYLKIQIVRIFFRKMEKNNFAIKHAEKKKLKVLKFFSLFLIKKVINYLEKVKIKFIKIPSGEINNFDLLKKINKNI